METQLKSIWILQIFPS